MREGGAGINFSWAFLKNEKEVLVSFCVKSADTRLQLEANHELGVPISPQVLA